MKPVSADICRRRRIKTDNSRGAHGADLLDRSADMPIISISTTQTQTASRRQLQSRVAALPTPSDVPRIHPSVTRSVGSRSARGRGIREAATRLWPWIHQ